MFIFFCFGWVGGFLQEEWIFFWLGWRLLARIIFVFFFLFWLGWRHLARIMFVFFVLDWVGSFLQKKKCFYLFGLGWRLLARNMFFMCVLLMMLGHLAFLPEAFDRDDKTILCFVLTNPSLARKPKERWVVLCAVKLFLSCWCIFFGREILLIRERKYFWQERGSTTQNIIYTNTVHWQPATETWWLLGRLIFLNDN